MFGRLAKISLLSGLLLSLTACHNQEDKVVAYLQHPQTLKAELNRCQLMGEAKAKQDSNCLAAIYAYQQVLPLSKDMMQSPEKYGQMIMAAQSQLVSLKGQYQKDKTPQLAKKIDEQQFKINIMRAVVFAVEG